MTTHTHTLARGRALSVAVWAMREQYALKLESFQHRCVFVWMIIGEWTVFIMCDWRRCFVMASQRKEEDVLTAHFSLWGGNLKDFNALFQCVCVIKVKAACDHVRVCDIWPILHFTVNRMIRNFTSVSLSCCGLTLYDLWTLRLSWIKKKTTPDWRWFGSDRLRI